MEQYEHGSENKDTEMEAYFSTAEYKLSDYIGYEGVQKLEAQYWDEALDFYEHQQEYEDAGHYIEIIDGQLIKIFNPID